MRIVEVLWFVLRWIICVFITPFFIIWSGFKMSFNDWRLFLNWIWYDVEE